MSDHVVVIGRRDGILTVDCSCGEGLSGSRLTSITLDLLTEIAHEHIELAERDPLCICGHGKSRHGPAGTCIEKSDTLLGRFADECLLFQSAERASNECLWETQSAITSNDELIDLRDDTAWTGSTYGV